MVQSNLFYNDKKCKIYRDARRNAPFYCRGNYYLKRRGVLNGVRPLKHLQNLQRGGSYYDL